MTTQVIEVGRPTIRWQAIQPSRVNSARVRDALFRLLAVTLFVLALLLMTVLAPPGAGAPTGGPMPGLGL